MDAVLPLTLRDVDRSRILMTSLDRFFQGLDTCWVVTPDHELKAIKEKVNGKCFNVVPETSIAPELARFKYLSGWYKHQLVTLSAANVVASDFYLTLDADVVCIRPTMASEFVKDGKALCHKWERSQVIWNRWSERVLRLKGPGHAYGVTPVVLNKKAVGLLASHLETLAPSPLGRRNQMRYLRFRLLQGIKKIFGGVPSGEDCTWRLMLLNSIPWTDIGLYFTFLEAAGHYEEFYVDTPESFYGNCVWKLKDYEKWQPPVKSDASLRPFMIFQSTTNIPAEVIWGRMKDYFA